MISQDLVSIGQLILGLFLVTILLILMKLGKIKLEMWPPILGIGAGVYTFAASMIESIILRPTSEFVNYTINSLFVALIFGPMGYFGGRIIVRNSHDKNR